ncbi:MAG: sigma-54 dependent transcriptional regulator [Myxococcales bacterium]|nr:sigma-54 dependent transcriptional regulator [Myxococcales bacterium]
MGERVLVVDDENVLRDNLVRFLSRSGHDAVGVATAEDAAAALSDERFALVITDLRMPGMGGDALLRQISLEHPDVLVVVMTAFGSLESAVEALRHGAQDYLVKPLSLQEVQSKVDRLLKTRRLEHDRQRRRRDLRGVTQHSGIVAESDAMRRTMTWVRKAAASRSTVLVEGESGVGKELVARALHELSPWADREFIAVNLAAQPRDLVDATLFGHERGAYTGATRSRQGVFRAAQGGTVFLDEVAELPLDVQVKLLRVLENREVLPLGADRPQAVDVRLVAATNRPLRKQVEAGAFRQDLFFRLEVVRIDVPPLRERRADLAPLLRHFLAKHAEQQGRAAPQIDSEAMAALRTYRWPGNVRELSNAVERTLLLCDDDWITAADLPPSILAEAATEDPDDLKEALMRFERQHISLVLERCEGDKPRAAARLGIHVATLYRHLERLGLS